MSSSFKKEESPKIEPSESELVRSDILDKFKSSKDKKSMLGGKVKQEMCSPLSIHFLALNRISMYLLISLVAGAVVGHNIITSCSEPLRLLKPGIKDDNLFRKHLVLFANVAHSRRK